jgi:hypothetical protein
VTLDVEMRDGDLTFEGRLADTSGHRIDCQMGDVTLRLPPDTALWLDASTRHGRIDNELSIQADQGTAGDEDSDGSDEERLEGAINGGKTKLQIGVRDGNIALEVD